MALYSLSTVSIPEHIDSSPTTGGTISSVAVGDNPTEILSQDSGRKGFTIFNNSTQEIFLGIDGNVSAADNFFAIIPGKTLYEWSSANPYTGAIHGVTATYEGGAPIQTFSFS